MRHGHIGDAFFDLDAARFLLEEMAAEREAEAEAAPQQGAPPAPPAPTAAASGPPQQPAPGAEQRPAHQVLRGGRHGALGHAAGPSWAAGLPPSAGAPGSVTLEYGCEVAAIEDAPLEGWPAMVSLTNGARYGVDLVVAAVGVAPAVDWAPPEVRRAPDGGLEVDADMQTSAAGVYAAGDACSATWALEASPHWFQMRLWSQARATGAYAAHCMAGVRQDTGSDMAFELFTHVTRFMGRKASVCSALRGWAWGLLCPLATALFLFFLPFFFAFADRLPPCCPLQVVLLGLYNGQRLEHEPSDDIITYSRIGEGEHGGGGGCCGKGGARRGGGGAAGRTFVRVLLLRGRVQGAVLIGETDLEETFENLILDRLDVGQYGPALLDPDAELDHVFD
jgi:hypothetical protein